MLIDFSCEAETYFGSSCIRSALKAQDLTENAIQLIQDTSRETTAEFMKMNEYVDVLIPRGGRGLIKAVVNGSTIPVIETGTGNCHIYVDESADLNMAADIVMNAKTQRVGVCNACGKSNHACWIRRI